MLQILLTIVGLNIATFALATLRQILLIRGVKKVAYIVAFFESLFFVLGLVMVANAKALIFVIANAGSRVVGIMLGDFIDSKLPFGLLEMTFSAKTDKAILIADSLRELGYTVDTKEVFGYKGSPRLQVEVVVRKNDRKRVLAYLDSIGLNNLSYMVHEVKSIHGKINHNVIPF